MRRVIFPPQKTRTVLHLTGGSKEPESLILEDSGWLAGRQADSQGCGSI